MRLPFLFLLLAMVSFSTWTDTSASDQFCFNVTSSHAIYTSNNSEWTVIDLQLPWNATFFGTTLGSDTDVFMYAHNSTVADIFLPAVTANNTQYCLYSGGMAKNDLSGISFIYHDGTSTNMYSSGSYTHGSGYVNCTTCSFSKSANWMSNYMVKGKMNASVTGGAANFSGVCSNGSSWGPHCNAMSNYWRGTGAYYPPSSGWMIAEAYSMWAISDFNSSLYDVNGTYLNRTNTNAAVDNNYLGWYTNNNNASMDWFIASRVSAAYQSFSYNTPAYDHQDFNISILSPNEGSIINAGDTLLIRISFLEAFDNCTILMDGVNYKNVTSPGIGTYQASSSLPGAGSILMEVSCSLSGVESHAYRNFVASVASASYLFTSAFGYDATSGCTGTVLSELSKCTQYYHIPEMYDFGAVVCPGVDTGISYACLSLPNYTKTNNLGEVYQIFYSPSYWNYAAGLNVTHIGATFYYNNAPVTMGMELIDNQTFIYIPAQNKPFDTNVYYLNTGYPASGWGFIVNDRHVAVSNPLNDWFIAAGQGIVNYNSNYSQTNIPVSVIPLGSSAGGSNLTGFYTRLNCYQQGGNFVIQVTSTVARVFTVNVSGNTSYSYSTAGYNLYDNFSMAGAGSIEVLGDDDRVCYYDGKTNMLLPFSLASLGDGFNGIFIAVLMMFSVILSSVVPYALVIPFLLNDIYHVLSVPQLGIIVVLAAIGGLANNIFAMEKGIKNMVILLAIVIACVVTLKQFTAGIGVDFDPLTNSLDSFDRLFNGNSWDAILWNFVVGTPTFIINLFILIIKIPAIIIGLVYGLLNFITPEIAAAFIPFKNPLIIAGEVIYLLKGYEVLTNKFRNV